MLDVAVIGCGIVGANVAYLLSQHKLRAAVFEKENDVSMGTTRANSAIVHAGYDPEPGTAMARLNVRGSALTKEQCAAFDVKYRQIGSLVLPTAKGDSEARAEVNAAGVEADLVAAMAGEPGFTTIPSRGEYYLLDKSQGYVVNHVVFQCPNRDGKGVLVSPTVHYNLIVGPNAEPSGREDVSTQADALAFVREKAVKSVPGVNFRENIRNFAGVRANTDQSDFIIGETAPGFITLGGIKSPGLSSAPAIAEDALALVAGAGVTLEKKESFVHTRTKKRFNEMTPQQKAEAIRENPLYGRVICRCETVTEGEIVDALHRPIPPRTIDGVKRRCTAGMGRCQGGFCGPRVHEIIARELGIPQQDVLKDRAGSYIITGTTKEGGLHHGE